MYRIKYKLAMLWIKIKSPFRSVCYRIKTFFEIRYWYFWRNDTPLWFDEDKNKWVNASTSHAKDTIYSWWSADSDLLGMMLLKIDHMFYKLKKDGVHCWQYLDSYVFNEKYATKSDKDWALKKALSTILDPKNAKDDYRIKIFKEKNKVVKYSRWIGNIHEFDGRELDILEGRLQKGQTLTEDMQKKLEELREKKKTAKSESGLIHHYLTHVVSPKEDYYLIEKTVDKVSKEKGYSALELDSDNNFETIPIPNYVETNRTTLLRFEKFTELGDIDKMLTEYLGEEVPIFHAEENFLLDQQTFEVKNEDLPLLSPKVREQVRGRRQDLIHLLQVRHALKKIMNHDDYDKKYNTWYEDKSLNDEERHAEMKRCRKLYEDDRKKYYRNLADILAKYGETFWD